MVLRLYYGWIAAVLLLLAVAQYRGWSVTGDMPSRSDPRSMRNNPGSYRSSYYVPGRTLRGK